MKFLDQKGFSLIEIMIAGGLIGALGVGVVTMTQNANKTVKTSESKNEIVGLIGEIRALISSPAACDNTFSGLNAANSTSITELKSDDNSVKYTLDTKRGSVKIVSMQLKENPPETQVNTSAIGDTDLLITFSKGKGTFGQDITKKIKIWVKVDGAKNIINCRLGAGGGNIWERSIVNVNDIFYVGGNIGIGETNPSAALDIASGSLKFDKDFGIMSDARCIC